jgi:hypothetical protein
MPSVKHISFSNKIMQQVSGPIWEEGGFAPELPPLPMIAWDLTDTEHETLREIGYKYVSAGVLWEGYDDERKEISAEDAISAFIATAGDGGDIGTVPLAGGTLKKKIEDLWERSTAWDFFDAAEAYGDEISRGEESEHLADYIARQESGEFVQNALCPVGTEVQTLIFDPELFNKTEAKRWAKESGFKATKIDETRDSYRIRQKDPRSFKKTGFRTIDITEGVKAVIGCPR